MNIFYFWYENFVWLKLFVLFSKIRPLTYYGNKGGLLNYIGCPYYRFSTWLWGKYSWWSPLIAISIDNYQKSLGMVPKSVSLIVDKRRPVKILIKFWLKFLTKVFEKFIIDSWRKLCYLMFSTVITPGKTEISGTLIEGRGKLVHH